MKKLLLVLAFLPFGFTYGQCNDKVMESYGGTCSIALYNSYIAIGVIADGYFDEVYDDERIVGLMDEQLTMYDVIVEQLKAVRNDPSSKLSEGDKTYIDNVIKCWGHLKNEAQGLKNVATETNMEEDLYNTGRDAAWLIIAELMGFEE